jgi:hypothetical protein
VFYVKLCYVGWWCRYSTEDGVRGYHLYIRTEHECSSANLGYINSPDVPVRDCKERFAKFEILLEMIMRKAVYWYVTPCNLADVSLEHTFLELLGF